jgi:hypothetical protein
MPTRSVHFAAGAAVAALLLLAAGETFLRRFPPSDFRPYLGDESGLAGPFRPDERFGVQYRSWQVFVDDHPGRPTRIESPHCWAMFGSSFVHMHGMLADTTQAALPDRPVFNLGRNEWIYVRAAQVSLLLEHGERPERIFFVLMPLDCWPLVKHSLSQLHVTPQGGVAYVPRDPGGLGGWAIQNSRLALMAWVRTGRHEAVPSFQPRALNTAIPAPLKADLTRLLTDLGESGLRHGVPITVVLIPNHEQITDGAAFGFQDELTPLCQRAGLDVCDVRRAFLAADDKPGLFIPDKHFSQRGNRLLLGAILDHLGESGAAPWESPTRERGDDSLAGASGFTKPSLALRAETPTREDAP